MRRGRLRVPVGLHELQARAHTKFVLTPEAGSRFVDPKCMVSLVEIHSDSTERVPATTSIRCASNASWSDYPPDKFTQPAESPWMHPTSVALNGSPTRPFQNRHVRV